MGFSNLLFHIIFLILCSVYSALYWTQSRFSFHYCLLFLLQPVSFVFLPLFQLFCLYRCLLLYYRGSEVSVRTSSLGKFLFNFEEKNFQTHDLLQSSGNSLSPSQMMFPVSHVLVGSIVSFLHVLTDSGKSSPEWLLNKVQFPWSLFCSLGLMQVSSFKLKPEGQNAALYI